MKVRQILHKDEAEARELMSSEYLSFPGAVSVGDALQAVRQSRRDPETISYLYVVGEDFVLVGVADIRELILAPDDVRLSDIMSTSVVSAEADKTRKDLDEIFRKYRFRMVPVVDTEDHLLGVIRSNDLIVPDQNE